MVRYAVLTHPLHIEAWRKFYDKNSSISNQTHQSRWIQRLIFIDPDRTRIVRILWNSERTVFLSSQNEETQGIFLNQEATLERLKFDESVITRLHPYFGFIYQPGIPHPGVKVNNMGFLSPFKFPFTKDNSNQLIVGITGGSVASNVAINEFSSSTLRNKLKQVPAFKDKYYYFKFSLGRL
jgi:hypothetical protein